MTTSPAPTPQKAVKERRMSRRLERAIDLLASDPDITQRAAAQKAGITEEHLSRMLKRPQVAGVLQTRARATIAAAAPRAAARMVELLGHDSGRVALDASTRLLDRAGLGPPSQPGVVVNNHGPAGYVIRLDKRDGSDATVIDGTFDDVSKGPIDIETGNPEDIEP